MLRQESTQEPFIEEEVAEEVLSALQWRAEARVMRPVLARGGIIADQVGYGKTAITLGLIDASKEIISKMKVPEEYANSSIVTKATLVIVPQHLMGQWPSEIEKFVGDSLNVVALKTMADFNQLSVKEVVEADVVLANFTVLQSELYLERLARLGGANGGAFPSGKTGGRHFNAVYAACLSGLKELVQKLKDKKGGAKVHACSWMTCTYCANNWTTC